MALTLLCGCCGLILSLFRLPLSSIRPLDTFLVIFVIAAPALALIAGFRMLMQSRPWLRGAWGDVLFFIFWMAGIIVAATQFSNGGGSPFQDIFGYASSISGSTDIVLHSVSVGAGPTTNGAIDLDPVKGISEPDFLISRLLWLIVSLGAMCVAAVIFKPRNIKLKTKRQGIIARLLSGLDPLGQLAMTPILSGLGAIHPLIRTNLKQLVPSGWAGLVLVGISISGFILPFRKAVGPALMLVMIFLISHQSSLWEKRHNRQFRVTLPNGLGSQFFMTWLSIVLFTALLLIPSVINGVMKGNLMTFTPDMIGLTFIMPVVILALGVVTRTGIMARLLMLAVWYVYLNV